jgi:hypothetical protein
MRRRQRSARLEALLSRKEQIQSRRSDRGSTAWDVSGFVVDLDRLVEKDGRRLLTPAHLPSSRRRLPVAAPARIGVWQFPEPVLEMCIRSERYDQEITLLQFEEKSAIFHEEGPIHDAFDQFMSNDRIG